jgi:cytochrome b561
MAVFGILAFLTGELADDGINSFGYLLHAYLGLSLAIMMLTRITVGLTKVRSLSFKNFALVSNYQWKLALEDLRSLLQLKIPKRNKHQGLAGLTHSFGLIIFSWMAITGSILFMIDSSLAHNTFELIEELHEVGETLIPLYLLLHVGAVILHTMNGHPIWKNMFSTK